MSANWVAVTYASVSGIEYLAEDDADGIRQSAMWSPILAGMNIAPLPQRDFDEPLYDAEEFSVSCRSIKFPMTAAS